MNENQPSKLPPAPLIQNSPSDGAIPLPPTSLLSEAERKRLDELAAATTAPAEKSDEDVCTTFADGSFFKWLPRKDFHPQCLLVDAAGQVIAIAKNSNLADFLVNATNLFALAQLKHEADGTAMPVVSKPIIFPGQ